MSAPPCPGCQEPASRNPALCGFCPSCWTQVPAGKRTNLDRAAKAMGKHPASRQVREAYVTALKAALGHVQ